MKTLTKETYNLPAEVMAEFEKQVAPGKRGAVIGSLINQWMEEKRREQLRARILEGLQSQKELDEEIEREWSPISDEIWSGIGEEIWPEPSENYPHGLKDDLGAN